MSEDPRTYLAIVDDSPESRVAVRYAALRAAHVGARLLLLNVVRRTEFMQWGRVQEAIEAELADAARATLVGVADEVARLTGQSPSVTVAHGEPATAILAAIRADPGIRAIVLGAASRGTPGPLVDFFSGERAGALPCIVMIVPGGLDDAALARLA